MFVFNDIYMFVFNVFVLQMAECTRLRSISTTIICAGYLG